MGDPGFIFSLIAALVTLGGLLVAFGVLKQKIIESAKTNEQQAAQIEERASKQELSAAMKRSDELLDFMRERAEEDRLRGDGRYKELYGIIGTHGERIGKLEISQEQIFKMLDKLEIAVSSGFHDLRQDMKELREALKQQ
jgi:S-methylmethionine-dependent homocysteine/selenocysteine methylase